MKKKPCTKCGLEKDLKNANRITRILKKEKPESIYDLLLDCGLSLKFLGDGAFREVFKIVGTGLVVKVPRTDGELMEMSAGYAHTPVDHAHAEWDHRKKVMREKKYEFFRPYMPALHCLVPSTGVLLADYYRPLPYTRTKYDAEIDQIIGSLAAIGVNDGDVAKDKKDNYGIDRDGKLRIIDLGCFGGELE
jgi:hypothetical protein